MNIFAAANVAELKNRYRIVMAEAKALEETIMKLCDGHPAATEKFSVQKCPDCGAWRERVFVGEYDDTGQLTNWRL